MEDRLHKFSQNTITLRRSSDGWEVVVDEDGVRLLVDFSAEESANNFVVDQIMRLGVVQLNRETQKTINR